MVKRAYSYIRFSTPDQIKGNSLLRQTTKSREWAERSGYTLDDSLNLRDLGISGYRGKNLETGRLGAFLEAIKDGTVQPGSVLLIENLDRLTRAHIRQALTLFLSILEAGITIVTIEPEYTFKPDAGENDTTQLLIAIIDLTRGHGESARKSYLGSESWKAKRAKIDTIKMTGRCPAWLKLSEDRKQFLMIPEKVAIVQRIFQEAIEGRGIATIAKQFNIEGIKALAHGVAWHDSYILKILNNRAVLGEYQPCTGHGFKERKPIGDPIADYYPPVISEATFYKAQSARRKRATTGGPIGKSVANLFTGLLFDAQTGSTMTLVKKGVKSSGPSLVSSAATRGMPGSKYVSIPYEAFEWMFFEWTKELQIEDVLGKTSGGVADDLVAAKGRLTDLDLRLSTFRESLLTDPNFKTILGVVRQLEAERNEVAAKVDKLKAELHSSGNRPLQSTQDLIRLLAATEGNDLYNLRIKLRAAISNLIAEIWVLVDAHSTWSRQAMVQVHFRSGGYRRLVLITKRGQVQSWGQPDKQEDQPATWDLRHWREQHKAEAAPQ